MTLQDFYAYLVRARRDLWAFLRTLPDDDLGRAANANGRYHSIKDLLFHTAAVEDSWLHEDILRTNPVWERLEGFPEVLGGPHFDEHPLEWILDYAQAVERATLAFLETATPETLARTVTVPSRTGPARELSAGGLLWHVAQHEVRHTAQVALLARQLGHEPPMLDLLRYL